MTTRSKSEQNNGQNPTRTEASQGQHLASSAGTMASDAAKYYVQEPAVDLFTLLKEYAKENPDIAMCWAFGAGLVLGWRLKP